MGIAGSKNTKPSPLENASKTGRLVLADNKLESLPPGLWLLGHTLRLLDLSGNRLTELPSQIGSLIQLQSLKLSNNRLVRLPEEIYYLTNLKTLVADHNLLEYSSALPRGCLRNVDLSFNCFAGEVGHPSLAMPPCVYVCKLSDNRITSIAPSFGFETLRDLQELDLDNNSLKTIPSEIGALSKLSCLKLRNNMIETLPAELFHNTLLSRLHLEGNVLTLSTLREIDGFEKYLERRKDRISKGMDHGLKQDQRICGLLA